MTIRQQLAASAGTVLVLGTTLLSGPARAQEHEHDRQAAEPAAAMAEDWRVHHDADALEAAVLEVVRGFRAALSAGDSTAALAHLHPEASVYESGHAETVEEYRAGHLAADMEFHAGTTRENTAERVIPSPHMALYESIYEVEGSFRGREVSGGGVETLVLVPAEGGWKIRHIHWSSGR